MESPEGMPSAEPLTFSLCKILNQSELEKNHYLRNLVRPSGIEPLTYSLEGCCSIRLSYGRLCLQKTVLTYPALAGFSRRDFFGGTCDIPDFQSGRANRTEFIPFFFGTTPVILTFVKVSSHSRLLSDKLSNRDIQKLNQ